MTLAPPSPKPCPLWQRLIIGRKPKRTLLRAAVLAALCWLVIKFAFLPARVSGLSMAPTYSGVGINVINRLAYRWHPPRRGDVVAVRLLAGERVMLLKRVIGLPGETLAIERGVVLIDDKPIEEPYVKHRAPWQLRPRKLGPDTYFLIGDNRGMPQEMHDFGATQGRNIVGKVCW